MHASRLQSLSVVEREALAEIGPHRFPARLEIIPFGSAVAIVALAGYLICTVLAAINMNLIVALFQPWFHGVVLATSASSPVGFALGPFLLGLVTFTVTAWIVAAATAALYNRFMKGFTYR